MRKIIGFTLVCLLAAAVSADDLDFTQQDINTFLSFADEFIAMAAKYADDTGTLSLDQLYYLNSEELMTATEEFLKRYDWSYLKMNDFLYAAVVVLEYIMAEDVLGAEMGAMLGDMLEDIPPGMVNLIRKNKDALLGYFSVSNYADMLGDLGDLGDLGYPEEYEGMELSELPPPPPDFDMDTLPPSQEEDPGRVLGTWVLGSDNMYVWNFLENGTVSVNEVSPVAAEVGGWEGTYQVRGKVVSIQLGKPHPFPKSFVIKGDRLEGDDDYLKRHDGFY